MIRIPTDCTSPSVLALTQAINWVQRQASTFWSALQLCLVALEIPPAVLHLYMRHASNFIWTTVYTCISGFRAELVIWILTDCAAPSVLALRQLTGCNNRHKNSGPLVIISGHRLANHTSGALTWFSPQMSVEASGTTHGNQLVVMARQ